MTYPNRGLVRTFLLTLGFLLAGCGQESSHSATAVSIVSATATTRTSVVVVFSEAVDDSAAIPSNYAISAPDGSRLGIVAAYPGSDGASVTLATEPQQQVTYVLTARNVTAAADDRTTGETTTQGGFGGSGEVAPIVASAIALSNTTVLVTFGDPSNGTLAKMGPGLDNPQYYEISDPNLEVLAAAPGTDAGMVVLTTEPMSYGQYTVKVTNVLTAAGGKLIDPFLNTATFNGMPAIDTTPPSLIEAVSLDNSTVLLSFSEPLDDSSANPEHYVISGPGGPLVVTNAVLDEYGTRVTLTTLPQAEGVTYQLEVIGVVDRSGNVIIGSDGTASFTGSSSRTRPEADTEPPKLSNAGSTGNTSVVVTFSEPMDTASAENASHYSIYRTLDGTITAQAVVQVYSAVRSADGTSVTLTTDSQSDIEYLLTVTNVRDLAGNQIAPKDRLTGATNTTTFYGTPPSGKPVDADGDGLSNAEEQRGWIVTVELANGGSITREVTSDPDSADTDEDGVSDRDEKNYLSDPRDEDTDDDQLSDYQELNHVYSDPGDQDSDDDTLADGLEFGFFRTSPTLADSDGDQLLDWDEINLGNRNPRLADLPRPSIEVGAVDLQLDVRFAATSQRGTRELESRSVSSTLTQTDNQSVSNTDSNSHEFFFKTGVEASWKVGADFGYRGKFNVETGYTGQWTSSFTKESARETQEAYERSRNTEQELSVDESLSREVLGASMKLGVNLRSISSIAFNISNLQVTAFVQDQRNPEKLIPIATLVPEDEPMGGFNLGPLVPERGPLVFVDDQVFPALVEQLMRDPEGLIFKISNFDLTDEFGRNFAFTSQDVNDRTATVVIDYGAADTDGDGEGDTTERLKVATSAGRSVADTNGDAIIDDADRILFDPDGNQVGITVREALESVLGLTHYDEDANPSSGLSAVELANSYSTRVVNGVETLWRVRAVSKELANPLKDWEVLTPTGIDSSAEGTDFNSRLLSTEEGITLAFVQDLDDDGIPARWEYILGCSDTSNDFDGDGLLDYFEVYEGWPVHLPTGDYQGYASCARGDSDRDGLDDVDEQGHGTDAKTPDTDGDGLTDGEEVNGFGIDMRFEADLTGVTTDPLDPDTDGDSLRDGAERDLGTNPNVSDGDKVFDNDLDGLVNFQETGGWNVTTYATSSTRLVQGPATTALRTSDPNNPDTDGDGLNDMEEYELGTDPRSDDTDGDDIDDPDEIAEYDPLDADIDNDLRPDGDELNAGLIIEVVGENPYEVFSDPKVADVDVDGLVDGEESTKGTDPTLVDTDGDGANDRVESTICVDVTCRNPLEKDQKVTVNFVFNVDLDGDLDGAGGTGDFVHSLSIVRAGEANLTRSSTAYINNNESPTVWSPSFVKPYAQSITIDIAVYESDSGTTTDGEKCRIDNTKTFNNELTTTSTYSTPQVNDFVGDLIAECKYQVDVSFTLE